MELKSPAVAALALAVGIGAVPGCARISDKPGPPPDAVISGLGEPFPAARDVSESRDFHVYEFQKDGVTYVQLNTLPGGVLTAVALAGSDAYVLPIGTLAESQVAVAAGTAPVDASSADGRCPCDAVAVYDGAADIVVIQDANRDVVEVIAIPDGGDAQPE